MTKISDLLQKFSELQSAKEEEYGESYLQFGKIMQELFPLGLAVEGSDDWVRLGILVQIVSKLTRYAYHFDYGGHIDSAADLSVYGAMLAAVTHTNENDNKSFVGIDGNGNPVMASASEMEVAERYLSNRNPTNRFDHE